MCTGASEEVLGQRIDTLSFRELLNLPFEELLKIHVIPHEGIFVIYEKPDTSIIDIVEEELIKRSLSAEDILSSGYTSLADILGDNPSMLLVDRDYNYIGGHRGLWGDLSSLMIFINGREINSLYSKNAFITKHFNVNNIEYIELINGPGFLTANGETFGGIVNIKTKHGSDLYNSTEVQASFSTPNTRYFNGVIAQSIDDFRLGANFGYSQSVGYDYTDFIKTDEFSEGNSKYSNGINYNSNKYANESSAIPIALNLSYKGFYVGMDYLRTYTGQKGISQLSLDYNNANEEHRNFSVYYAGFKRDYSDKLKLKFEYNHYQEKIWGTNRTVFSNWGGFLGDISTGQSMPFGSDRINQDYTRYYSQFNSRGSQRNKFLSKVFVKFGEDMFSSVFLKGGIEMTAMYLLDHNDLRGMAYSYNTVHADFDEDLSSNNLMRLPLYNYVNHAGVIQFNKPLLNRRINLLLGAKYNLYERWDNRLNFSTKLNTLLLNDRLELYGLYRTASREASIEDFRPSVFNDLPNPFGEDTTLIENLIVNDIKSAEIGGSYASGKTFVGFALYRNKYMTNRVTPTFANAWENTIDTTLATGLEVSIKYKLKKVGASVAYSLMNSDNKNYYPHRLNLGLNVSIWKEVKLNAAWYYYSKMEAWRGSRQSDDFFAIPASQRVDLTLSSGKMPINAGSSQMFASLRLKNLFNNQIYQPNVLIDGPNQFLLKGRQLFATLTFEL